MHFYISLKQFLYRYPTLTTISVMLLFVVACKPRMLLTPDAKDEQIAKTKWADSDIKQLQAGYDTYTTRCNTCHSLHKPTEFDESRWMKIMNGMAKKAKLSDVEKENTIRYILAKRETLLSAKK
jgi:hypothetical protein